MLKIFENYKLKKELEKKAMIIHEMELKNLALADEIIELRKALEESRAKEGKGALETMIDGITQAFRGMDFSKLGERMNDELNELEIDDGEEN